MGCRVEDVMMNDNQEHYSVKILWRHTVGIVPRRVHIVSGHINIWTNEVWCIEYMDCDGMMHI